MVSQGPSDQKRDLYVVARILESLRRRASPMTRSKLQASANLNYDRFVSYVEWLADRKLIEMKNDKSGREVISITPKGNTAYRRFVEWLEEYVRQSRDD